MNTLPENQSKIDLQPEGKIEVLNSFIEENRRQVQWLKDLDFKTTEYCIIFALISIGWMAANGIGYVSKGWIISAFLIVPISGLLMLLRNHLRHIKLNEQWQQAAIALRLNQPGQYNEKAIVKIIHNEWLFHSGRIWYAIPVLATTVISIGIINHIFSRTESETKFKIGACVSKEADRAESKILKIVGYGDTSYVTFSHFFAEGKLVLGEDYNPRNKKILDKEYYEVTCPSTEGTFSPEKFINGKK